MIFGVSWSDAFPAIAGIASFPLAIWGVTQASAALRSQSTASDIQSVLIIWERFDCHWLRYKSCEDAEKKRFEFGQLIAYYELACGLFLDGALTTKAARTLEEHLDEILPMMRDIPEFAIQFDELISTPNTFMNIARFLSRHKHTSDYFAIEKPFAKEIDRRVANVRFDAHSLIVDLMDGRTISVPLAFYPRLLAATPRQRGVWEKAGAGYGTHWPELNEDLSTEGLLRGIPAPRGHG